jgi:hypothetical protein
MDIFHPDISPIATTDEAPGCMVYAAPSRGPFTANVGSPTESGAILLEDADGLIVGWATDIAGHTSEVVYPEGRSPRHIAVNARLFAEAWEMLAVMGLIAMLEPIVTLALTASGQSASEYLTMAATRARAVMTRVYATP